MTIAAADVIAERYARVREDVGPSVTVVVATTAAEAGAGGAGAAGVGAAAAGAAAALR